VNLHGAVRLHRAARFHKVGTRAADEQLRTEGIAEHTCRRREKSGVRIALETLFARAVGKRLTVEQR
jgi:hypothetical protein